MIDKIKNLDRRMLIVVAAVLVVGIGLATTSNNNSATEPADQQVTAQNDTEANQNQPQEEPAADSGNDQSVDTSNDQPAETGNQYHYVAQAGDSYSKMARKAVQTYGIVNDVNLSLAEIIAAETRLTKNAGDPMLEIGQKVSFKQADVQAAVEYAQGLSDSAEDLWATYVPFVDFNTDSVGEPRQ